MFFFFKAAIKSSLNSSSKILAEYKIQDNKFHAAGYSNGGTSAFLVAASYPQYFLSITAFPGYLLRYTEASLSKLSKLCVNMYVGELDSGFRDLMRKQFDQFREFGLHVRFFTERGQGHMLETLSGSWRRAPVRRLRGSPPGLFRGIIIQDTSRLRNQNRFRRTIENYSDSCSRLCP